MNRTLRWRDRPVLCVGLSFLEGGTLYFTANDGVNGDELWKSDGTAGTVLVANVIPGRGASSPTSLTESNNNLFFRAIDIGNPRDAALPNTPTNLLTANGPIPMETGVRVGVTNVEGNGERVQVVVVKGQGTIPRVRVYRIVDLAQTGNFLAFNVNFAGGLNVECS